MLDISKHDLSPENSSTACQIVSPPPSRALDYAVSLSFTHTQSLDCAVSVSPLSVSLSPPPPSLDCAVSVHGLAASHGGADPREGPMSPVLVTPGWTGTGI